MTDPAATEGAVLVVIGGLPGSGKTTLLRRLLARPVPGVTGLDSELVAERIRAAGGHVPYRYLRPWVHLAHRARVLRGIGGRAPVVVLTDPWTSPAWRAAVLRAARRAGREVRVVLIAASPDEAASGQAARGRALSPRAMRRHAARWHRTLRSVDGPDVDSFLVVGRSVAAAMSLADLLGSAARPVRAARVEDVQRVAVEAAQPAAGEGGDPGGRAGGHGSPSEADPAVGAESARHGAYRPQATMAGSGGLFAPRLRGSARPVADR